MGDRTLGAEPMRVAALGRAVIEGLADGGVVGIVKHMPGHGRAMVDSHHELPIVTADEDALAIDLAPFQAVKDAHRGMTAHEIGSGTWRERRCAAREVVGGAV